VQDSSLVRTIDRHIGTAICGLISIARIADYTQQKTTHSPKKILLIELFEMGASVMLIPSIRFLKNQDPEIEIHFLTTKSCLPILIAINLIDPKNIHIIESESALGFIWSSIKKIFTLRKMRFDLIIDYELFMRIPAIFSGLLKSAFRSGFYKYQYEGLNRGSFYQFPCYFNQNSHISQNYLSLTKTAFLKKIDSPNFKDRHHLQELDIKPTITNISDIEVLTIFGQAHQNLKPYIVICPSVGKTLSMRNYPLAHFASLTELLLKKYPEIQIVFIGTSDEKQTTLDLITLLSEKGLSPNRFCLDLCGMVNFPDLLKVIARANLLITNDNGPGHFATLTGTKVLGLFSTDSPFVYGPLGSAVVAYSFYQCSPCISAYNHKVSICDDNRCLKALNPNFVFDLAVKLIDNQVQMRTINGLLPYIF
jgi:ADP-heptose:LPS heptosyltransferase